LYRYTIKTVKAIARNYEEAYERGFYLEDYHGLVHRITDPFRIAEFRADYDMARRAVGKNYERICDYLNGEDKSSPRD